MFENCCMRSKNLGKSGPLTVKKIKEGNDWPDSFKFDKIDVKTGLSHHMLDQEIKMAALVGGL